MKLGDLEAKSVSAPGSLQEVNAVGEEKKKKSVQVKAPASSDKPVIQSKEKPGPRIKSGSPGVVGEPGLRQTSCSSW